MNKQIGVTLTADVDSLRRGMSSAQAATVDFARQSESALSRASVATTRYGRSQKELSMAMRGVPAQITDIVTSLQGGQRPMTVLLQQGGQLKDMFGGVVPAARAMGGALVSMINPATLVAGAAVALGAAWVKGASEMDDLRKQIIMTGDALGVSVNQASMMATAMDNMAGITHGQAVAALTEVAKSGTIAGDQMETVATIAIRSGQLLGRETSKVVEEFSKLAAKPSEAVVKLNNKYHFLTAAVYDQIRALEQQGQTQDAARLAIDTYANAVTQRLHDVQRSLGVVEKAWNSVKERSKEAWDSMLDISRPKTTADIISATQSSLERYEQTLKSLGLSAAATEQDLQNTFLSGSDYKAAEDAIKQIRNVRIELASLNARAAGENFTSYTKNSAAQLLQERIEARHAWDEQTEHFKTLAQQRAEDIADAKHRAALIGATEEELAKRIQQINAEYASKSRSSSTKPRAATIKAEDPLGDFIKAIRPTYTQYEAYISKISGEADKARVAQQTAWLEQAVDVGRISYEQYAQAMNKISLKSEDVMGQLGEFTLEAARNIQDNLGDNLYDLLKGNFDDIGDAFEDTLLRMVANATSANLSSALFGDFDKTGSIGGIVGSIGSAIAGLLEPSAPAGVTPGVDWVYKNAKGNVYAGPSISAYSNTVVDKPTFFARGGNVMGEAGPEAILPLKRGPDGNLGVRAMAGQNAAPNIEINIINQSSQPIKAKQGPLRADAVKGLVQDIFLSDLRVNGPMSRGIKGIA